MVRGIIAPGRAVVSSDGVNAPGGVVADRLPGVTLPVPAVQPRGVISCISRAERKGDWALPAHLWVCAVIGEVRLDLRYARFLPGVSEIEIFTVLGEVKITLPHGVRVDCEQFKIRRVSSAVPRSDAPCIRIVGGCYGGNVKIKVVDPNA
jgi:hypothetical protein